MLRAALSIKYKVLSPSCGPTAYAGGISIRNRLWVVSYPCVYVVTMATVYVVRNQQ
jgi:hypothetical protein